MKNMRTYFSLVCITNTYSLNLPSELNGYDKIQEEEKIQVRNNTSKYKSKSYHEATAS